MNNLFEERPCLSQTEIKQYIQGQLTQEEVHKIEQHLIDCPFCSDAIEGFGKLQDFSEAESLLAEMDAEFAQKITPISKAPQKAPYSLRLVFLRAAAAILLLGIPIGALLYWQESKDQRLYAAYFETDQSGFDYSARTSDSALMRKEPFFQALQHYDREDFDESLVFLREHLRDSTTDYRAHFYAGVSYLRTGKTEKASQHLETILTSNPATPKADVLWYLALAKLKQGDQERAKSLLMLLTQSENYYNTPASDLLIDLR